jgi:transposase-like protein
MTTTSLPGVMSGVARQPGGTLALITGDLVRAEDAVAAAVEEEIRPRFKYRRLVDLDDLTRQEIIEAYHADQTIAEICRAYELNPATLYQMLRDMNVAYRGIGSIKRGTTVRADVLPEPTPEETPMPIAQTVREEELPIAIRSGTEYAVTYTIAASRTITVHAENVGEAFVRATREIKDGASDDANFEIVSVTKA